MILFNRAIAFLFKFTTFHLETINMYNALLKILGTLFSIQYLIVYTYFILQYDAINILTEIKYALL